MNEEKQFSIDLQSTIITAKDKEDALTQAIKLIKSGDIGAVIDQIVECGD